MEHYAASLRDVGEHVLADHGGRFEALVEAADGSAVGLADLLAGWEAFADASTYDGQPVPFYKRAQIAAADVNRSGLADLREEDRLTAFADNLVPHVLRIDGVLRLDPALEGGIDAGELLAHGSAEEVELRACAVHAIELLSAAYAALARRDRRRPLEPWPRPALQVVSRRARATPPTERATRSVLTALHSQTARVTQRPLRRA